MKKVDNRKLKIYNGIDDMTEQGKVIKIEKNEAVVRVQRKSACASCGMCAMKPKDSHIDCLLYTSDAADEL